MPKIIDVLMVIDAERIIQDAETIIQQLPPHGEPDPEHPIDVNSDMVYMITGSDHGLSGDHSPSLSVKVGDVIRWWATTLNERNYHVLLCKFKANPNEPISPAQCRLREIKKSYPNMDNPSVPQTEIITGYYWGSDALERGEMVIYDFDFMILNRDNEVLGYYYTGASLSITF